MAGDVNPFGWLDMSRYSPLLEEMWCRAEETCTRTERGSWPVLEGPFQTFRGKTYQVVRNRPDGRKRDEEPVGIGDSPVAALGNFIEQLHAPICSYSDKHMYCVLPGGHGGLHGGYSQDG